VMLCTFRTFCCMAPFRGGIVDRESETIAQEMKLFLEESS
jgi:hypothetical protein